MFLRIKKCIWNFIFSQNFEKEAKKLEEKKNLKRDVEVNAWKNDFRWR